ncbi:MAG TPA: SPFH domain-containing protein [Kofleriaceae bacterium]|nr:SPFH domain-containing protein [Kofleriaceae bacterium]
MANQQQVEVALKARRGSPPAMATEMAMAPAAPMRVGRVRYPFQAGAAGDAGDAMESTLAGAGVGSPGIASTSAGGGAPAIDVRVTGWWRWKTVVVPPNAHVVHTRRGRPQPLKIGLGTSFRYNPATDSFLVVPGTIQTILINAQCICRELQGLLVQGYVQWIIDDFSTAYQKLDFTDVEDPMRVVNVQLREQAEAAIKDKVATMGIDEVLSDKQPIIEELTARLRSVAEGEGGTDTGLGLRIVTVQIKEAVVSSKRVWEALQQPFRAERARIARLSEIDAATAIAARERIAERERETAQLAAEAELARLRALTETATYDRDSAEAARRAQREQETARDAASLRHAAELHAAELETIRVAHDAELARLRAEAAAAAARFAAEHQLAVDELQQAAANRQTEAELRFLEMRQRIANATSEANLQVQLIEALPHIADKLPHPAELRSISINSAGGVGGASGAGGDGSLAAVIAQVVAVLDGFRRAPAGPRQLP